MLISRRFFGLVLGLALVASHAYAEETPAAVADADADADEAATGDETDVSEEEEEEICEDYEEQCEEWAQGDGCKNNPKFMTKACRMSCGGCVTETADFGEIQVGEDPEIAYYNESVLKMPITAQMHLEEKISKTIQDSIEYVEWIRTSEEWYWTKDLCENKDKLCSYYATMDECRKNPNYMQVSCPAACKSCHTGYPHQVWMEDW